MKREYWRYFSTVFPYLRRHKLLVASSFVLMIVAALAALLEPWPLALLIDNVLGHHDLPQPVTAVIGTDVAHLIAFAVLAGFLVTLLIHGLAVLNEYVNTKIDQFVGLSFRSDLFAHCQKLSQAFHDETSTGDFMYRINFEAKAVGEMSVAFPPLAQSLLTLVGMFLVALKLDATLALLSLVVVPFVYYSTEFYGNRIEPRLVHVRGLEALSLTMVNEAMAMLRVITAFNRQRHEHERFREQGQRAVKARVNVTVRQTLFSLGVALITAAGVAIVLGVGALHVIDHRLSAGELLVVMSYIHSIYQPLQTVSATMAHFQERLIGVKYARQLLETQPEVKEKPNALRMGRSSGSVRFDGVCFSYPKRESTLTDISFSIEPGQVVAVVGPTGAGKSTLVALIPRFMDPSAGTVSIDGVDVRDLTLDSLREQVAFVQQEPLLFSRTIAENISYGRLDAGMADIEEAARRANAHDFISELPQGYQTKLGERGAKISGGERQRIAIARAFLKDAPIIILDEPTSSIDSRTEAVILDALDRLMQGRTTIIVAHRLSTVRSADQVLVLDSGRLVEQGNPEQLRQSGGLFSQLHRIQSGSSSPVTSTAQAAALARGQKIVVLGMMSRIPVAGVVWQTIHYLLGLKRLGFEVYYVEAHARTPAMLMRSEDDDSSARAAQFIAGVMHRFDLDGKWAFHALHADGACYGMSEARLRQLYAEAALIINLHGGTVPLEEHSASGRLVFLETDPVRLQVELEEQRRETIELLEQHCAYFTFAENYGRPDCLLPVSDRFDFHTTRQPVLLDLWEDGELFPRPAWTTIASWRQVARDITFRGERYGWSKHHEFLKFLDVPVLAGEPFELALAGYESEDMEMLRNHGWQVRSALELSADVDDYRRYIQLSRGEFTVAKDQNIRLRSGWFSDRSATYLAAGRPVITQDTGFGNVLPTGAGLFSFNSKEEILHAVEQVRADYNRHREAAREIAREHFSHDVVLDALLEHTGTELARPRTRQATVTEEKRTVPDGPAVTPRLPADMVLEPKGKRPICLEPATARAIHSRPLTPLCASQPDGPPEVSIVVVTWNNLTFNRLCIESVLEHTQLPEYELIVVDNCSVDGTRAYLDQRAEVDPRVRVIRNDGNVGFVKAANIGLRAARGNVLVLLNNDTIVAPGWLVRLSAYATRPEVGMVGPVSNQVSGEARVPVSYRTYGEYLDCARSFLERGQPREAGMLTLFCAAMRRNVYEQVGPLDERFVVGMFEDDDYSMRIREAGHVLMCADDVLVHHFGEASFGNLVPSGDYKLLFDENRSRFEEKWGVTWLSRRNRPDPVYDETRERLRSLIATETSGQDKVAIVTRGDDALLEQAGRRTCHFPSTAEGAYAGGYPKDSAEAIRQIRELSKGGCTHLVFPESSRWWLDHYEDLRSWLEGEATMVANQQGTGVIYSLSGGKHDVVTHAVSAR